MTLRLRLEEAFDRKAFLRPLFYRYPNGIRLELSEGGSPVNEFLVAMTKAERVCENVFRGVEEVTAILSVRAWGSIFEYREELRALHRTGIVIPKDRILWLERIEDSDEDEEDNLWARLIFNVEKSVIRNLLWCALSRDLGITPSPCLDVYLANLEDQVLLFPYDDRGMDVVGPNNERLSELYKEFRSYALEYDRAQMDATFNAA
jgi:hypothetical protein